LGLAASTTNVPHEVIAEEAKKYSAAVVPISAGKGVIPGFVEAVQAVLQHIGIKTRITGQLDVAGFGEAFESKVDIIFAADDRTFLAVNVRNRKVVENRWATANGFVQALAAAAKMRTGGLEGKKVLVIGLGAVGIQCLWALKELGAHVWVFDTDSDKARVCVDGHRDIQALWDLQQAFRTIDFVMDATPAAEIIDESMIRPSTIISCPGVPHGLTPAARTKIGSRFIHDNLSLGVCVMAVQSVELYSAKS
jgi:pyrrolysine biosynthesis protein PylD